MAGARSNICTQERATEVIGYLPVEQVRRILTRGILRWSENVIVGCKGMSVVIRYCLNNKMLHIRLFLFVINMLSITV